MEVVVPFQAKRQVSHAPELKILENSEEAWDTCLFGWNGTTTSIWNGVQLYGSESSSNFGKQGTADTDAEFAKVPSIKDKTEQFKQCNATEKKLMETYAYLPLFTGPAE